MSLPRHILSKSTYLYGLQCPRRLYFHKNRPDLLPEVEDPIQGAIFSSGTEAGILARDLFPGGIDASPATPFEYQEAVVRTAEYLNSHEVIYEACFQHEGSLCAVDILVKRDDLWYAFEVKGSNAVKPQHLTDAAFQYAVITGSGLPLGDISIVHFNRDYVRQGPLDVKQLFTAHSVRRNVLSMLSETREAMQLLSAMITRGEDPATAPGPHCMRPYVCPYADHCHAGFPEESIEVLSAGPSVQKKPLREFLQGLRYPLYFFDFEAYMLGIPPFDQTAPFQPIPFQYSLHRVRKTGGDLEQRFFLGDGISDPREALIRQMIHDLGQEGSILTWNVTYERTIIKRLIVHFPQYTRDLQRIYERMTDLMFPFKQDWVHLPAAGGSASLKRVLPALLPPEEFPELRYDLLDIQDGMAASYTYAILRGLEESERETLRMQLLAYCHLDTLAMVRIWEKLLALSGMKA